MAFDFLRFGRKHEPTSTQNAIKELEMADQLLKRFAGYAVGSMEPRSTTPRAMLFDPMAIIGQLEYKERYSPLTYDTLSRMADRCEVVSAIINTRCAQIGSFCQPSRWKKNSLGFRVRFKDSRREPSASEQERLNVLEEVIYRCGYTDQYRSGERRPNFGEFVRRSLRDSLRFDQMTWEIVPNRLGDPCEWWPIDAATIRIAREPISVAQIEDGRDIVKYVQIYNGEVRHQFTFRELAFCVRNQRNDIHQFGYGYSELESLIGVITAILFAEDYNRRFFSSSSMINGVLNLRGVNVSQDMIEAFRRQWNALVQGVAGSHRIPVTMVKDGVDFINLHSNNRDMEYAAWIEFLVKIATAVYLIDPAEVNFDYRGASESAPLFETSPEAKLKHSRDKGLRNLLNFLEEQINVHIVQKIDPSLYFEFVGIDMKDQQELINMAAAEVQAYKTMDEARREMGLAPLGKEKGGDLILNSVLVNWMLQQEANEMQMQGAAAGNGPQDNAGAGGPPNMEKLLANQYEVANEEGGEPASKNQAPGQKETKGA